MQCCAVDILHAKKDQSDDKRHFQEQ